MQIIIIEILIPKIAHIIFFEIEIYLNTFKRIWIYHINTCFFFLETEKVKYANNFTLILRASNYSVICKSYNNVSDTTSAKKGKTCYTDREVYKILIARHVLNQILIKI